MTTFVVFSLPRSRSTWLSVFLSYGGRVIGHDIGPDSTSPEDFMARLGHGTCETGAAFAWRAIRRMNPAVKFAVVLRDPFDVSDSLTRYALPNYLGEMQVREDDLLDIRDQPNTHFMFFEDLDDFDKCAALFRFCLGEELPRAWFDRFDAMNIQTDLTKQMAKLVKNQGQIQALKTDVRRQA